MFDVKMPPVMWFENGNICTGSMLTDPKKGIMNCTILEYSVKLMESDDGRKFCAVCRFRLPWDVRTNIEEYALAFFEGNEKGKSIAESWISRQVFMPAANGMYEDLPTGNPDTLIENIRRRNLL